MKRKRSIFRNDKKQLILAITVLALGSCHIVTYPFVDGFLPNNRPSCSFHGHPKRIRNVLERPVVSRPITEAQSTTKRSNFDNSIEDMEDKQQIRELRFYIKNLQRSRKRGDTKTAKSLSYYLRENLVQDYSKQDLQHIIPVCENALIQAIRTAGEAGDYKLVKSLIDGGIIFANQQPILTPRVFGEAIEALSRTGANVSKLKYVWRLVENGAPFLQNSLTAFELNIMMKALASRGRVRACVDIYRQHTEPTTVETKTSQATLISPDAYTASTLFSILTESISMDQQAAADMMKVPLSSSSSTLEASLKKLTKSPCWQWNAAVEVMHTLGDHVVQWNNHAYSSLLKLQDRAQDVYENHENGPRLALAILDSMRIHGVTPDVVTCTLAIKAMGKPANSISWKVALQFFKQMQTDPNLPEPNEYTYSAVIVACARSYEYNTALDLLDEMRRNSDDTNLQTPEPNTWVYNAVLLSISNPDGPRKNHLDKQLKTSMLALRLMEQMKDDHGTYGMNTKPDTVTYNTILAILGKSVDGSITNDTAFSLVKQMKEEAVPRDAITYHNAILACTKESEILQILHDCIEDDIARLEGKASQGFTFVCNTALSVFASKGNLEMFRTVFSLMQDKRISFDQDTTSHLLTMFGRSGNADAFVSFLEALADGNTSAFWDTEFVEKTGISLAGKKLPPVDVGHYSKAISASLAEGELNHAHAIFSMMREKEMTPTADCLDSFALAYAKAAGKKRKQNKLDDTKDPHAISKTHARNAFSITKALPNPKPLVLYAVAKACAITGQWKRARTILRLLQKQVLASNVAGGIIHQGAVDTLIDLQSTLLRECAKQGNVTAALFYVNDIQYVSEQLTSNQEETNTTTYPFLDDESLANEFRTNIGMRSGNWVSVIKAASKSGHWRVCFNTLQFLRPHVERTDPDLIYNENEKRLKNRYKQLVPALISAVRCMELRSQYAWALRSIQEWMTWSGRKAPPEAVLSAFRVLSSRGRGEEVKNLLLSCTADGPVPELTKKGVSYEEMLYIGAVTSLHKNGLYDDADEIYVSGVSQGHLPFVCEESNDQFILDLHGLNVAMAHSAVRVAMRQQIAVFNETTSSDMMIITGRGQNSAFHLRPVLRPEVQRMLLEEFYPPLNTLSVPGNMGALLVLGDDISCWQKHQEGQKGARMLALAAVLRNLSSNAIQQSIALTLDVNKDADS